VLELVKEPIEDVHNSVAVVGVHGGVHGGALGGADRNTLLYGSADCLPGNKPRSFVAASDLSPSVDAIDDFLSFIAPLYFPDQIDTTSLDDMEADIPWALHWQITPISFALPPRSFNLSKEPFSYSEFLRPSLILMPLFGML
jgi:hypothetical protein